ncbi:metallophosphoesterase [Parapedobacter deserti]|uniref:Metallophosphoesterase n=1 Tax=Parapedobacter deserti TaxID=1912957 RepID=A0ABV7JTK6_9SPHI
MTQSTPLHRAIALLLFSIAFSGPCFGQFRVLPYLLPADEAGSVRLTWFTETGISGKLAVWEANTGDTTYYSPDSIDLPSLRYSALEESERDSFPDMFANANWKHTVVLDDLTPRSTYHYRVTQGDSSYINQFTVAPRPGDQQHVRFIALADSETDPEGRQTKRPWSVGAQAPGSSGRPAGVTNYLLTETEGLIANLRHVKSEQPDFVMIAGDIVQGGGYQRAWDEFFFHTAGKFDDVFGGTVLLPALGNWENFGARNGGYEPQAVYQSRAKYKAYFTLPSNQHPTYQDAYYRVDYGPVTVITLDSSNGLPDSTDHDTNINISASTYPGDDLPDINPGSDQWKWAEAQLKDAHDAGQVVFVQFHHIPYSSGGHILPLTAENSSGQAGVPMRAYTPLFKKYGVVAVICGHNESLEHSLVDGIHFWDVGIAGDGLGYSLDDKDPRRANGYRQWVAHVDAAEHWDGRQLISGGKHYGHLVVDVIPQGEHVYEIIMIPQYIFPVTDEAGNVITTEAKTYDHIIRETRKFDRSGG